MKLDTSTELVLIGWTSWKGQVTSEECANRKGGRSEEEKEDGASGSAEEQRGGRGTAAGPDDIPFLQYSR